MAIKTETYDKEHKHFGGLIYQSDFNTYFDTDYRKQKTTQGSTIADRIMADLQWEEELKRKAKQLAEFRQNPKEKAGDAHGQ